MSSRAVVFAREDGMYLVVSQGRCRTNGSAKNAFSFTDSLQQATTFDHDNRGIINELIASIPKTNGHGFSLSDKVVASMTVQVTRKVQIVHGNYQPYAGMGHFL